MYGQIKRQMPKKQQQNFDFKAKQTNPSLRLGTGQRHPPLLICVHEVELPVGHGKTEVLEVLVEGHDLFLGEGVHAAKQLSADTTRRLLRVLCRPLSVKLNLKEDRRHGDRQMT